MQLGSFSADSGVDGGNYGGVDSIDAFDGGVYFGVVDGGGVDSGGGDGIDGSGGCIKRSSYDQFKIIQVLQERNRLIATTYSILRTICAYFS